MKASYLKFGEIFAILAMVFFVMLILLSRNSPIYIINLKDADYGFESGSSRIGVDFRDGLESFVIPEIRAKIQEYDYDVVEIIGHTDRDVLSIPGTNASEKEMRNYINRVTTFDRNIVQVALGENLTIYPGSNSDLGLMRALSIRKYLLDRSQNDPVLNRIKYFLPYSGAQLITKEHKVSAKVGKDDQSKLRRVEIRLLKTTMWQESSTEDPV